jgi:ubiquinone/menaquinone biosynthesis C-methylase UbiE
VREPAARGADATPAAGETAPGAHWQRADAVGWFLDERQARLPLIDVQEDVVRRLFERHGHEVARFLDLGAGDGALSQLMLAVFPQAEAVLVDFSEPMLAGVERRLAGQGRWQVVRGDLSDPAWRDALPGGSYGGAVSSLAIHHLPAARKRALYAEVYELLEPGAMFVNLDYVSVAGPLSGLWDEELLAKSVRLERERGGSRTAHELEHDLCDDADEDRPDPLDDQLRWLRESGFEDVEVAFKWAEAAVFGGSKPAGTGR